MAINVWLLALVALALALLARVVPAVGRAIDVILLEQSVSIAAAHVTRVLAVFVAPAQAPVQAADAFPILIVQ